MFKFKFTVMQEPDLQIITLFLSFRLFKVFENFKTSLRYYLSNFCMLINFRSMFPFYTRV